MATWRPAYLVHGDDHGRVSERRGSLRAVAEREAGAAGIEALEGEDAEPAAVARALQAMTLGLGRRFVLVDGAERYAEKDVVAHLVPALAALDEGTTVVFFAREEGKKVAPKALHGAVEKAGGQIVTEGAVRARDLPRWAVAHAERLGIRLDGAAAQALVAHAGERRLRLEREIEKLALAHGEGARIGTEEVDDLASGGAERPVWDLVDAIAGRDREAALRAYLVLRGQGEAVPRLTGPVVGRLRQLLRLAETIEAGGDPEEAGKAMRMSPWVLRRRVGEARDVDPAALRRAIVRFAELEVDARGGSELAEDTLAVRAIGAATGR